jgi:Lon protease-like protein
MNQDRIPLFPLGTVLCPGGLLPLRIFEPRYVDMVRNCMREENGFGVVLIASGLEVGPAADTEGVGTLARIINFDQGTDGLLTITARGDRRFRISTSEVNANQLRVGEVEYLAETEPVQTPERFLPLIKILEQILTRIGGPWSTTDTHYQDAHWLAGRLIELLPLDNRLKQEQLEQDDPLVSLDYLQNILDESVKN